MRVRLLGMISAVLFYRKINLTATSLQLEKNDLYSVVRFQKNL